MLDVEDVRADPTWKSYSVETYNNLPIGSHLSTVPGFSSFKTSSPTTKSLIFNVDSKIGKNDSGVTVAAVKLLTIPACSLVLRSSVRSYSTKAPAPPN